MTKQPVSWQQAINRRNLRSARVNLGLSTFEVGDKVFGRGKSSQTDRVRAWEKDELSPTYKQLEKLASIYNLNVFQFFIEERLEATEIPTTFRSDGSSKVNYGLRKFIDTLRIRQAIMSHNMHRDKVKPNPLVGSGRNCHAPAELAQIIRDKLGYHLDKQDALQYLRNRLQKKYIFVFKTMTTIRIKVEEMRGMYLHDNYAPCIAINRSDYKNSQLFTLAHEVAHLFRADERIDSIDIKFRHLSDIDNQEEAFCNQVAASLLIPAAAVSSDKDYTLEDVKTLAEQHQVSNLVSLYRLFDMGRLDKPTVKKFERQLNQEFKQAQAQKTSQNSGNGGGNYYNSMRDSNGSLFNESIFSLYLDNRLSAVEAQNLLKLPLSEI